MVYGMITSTVGETHWHVIWILWHLSMREKPSSADFWQLDHNYVHTTTTASGHLSQDKLLESKPSHLVSFPAHHFDFLKSSLTRCLLITLMELIPFQLLQCKCNWGNHSQWITDQLSCLVLLQLQLHFTQIQRDHIPLWPQLPHLIHKVPWLQLKEVRMCKAKAVRPISHSSSFWA